MTPSKSQPNVREWYWNLFLSSPHSGGASARKRIMLSGERRSSMEAEGGKAFARPAWWLRTSESSIPSFPLHPNSGRGASRVGGGQKEVPVPLPHVRLALGRRHSRSGGEIHAEWRP